MKNKFLNKRITRKIIKIIKKINCEKILDLYSGDNYIINSLIKKKKYLKLLNVEKTNNIKKIIFFNKIKNIKENKIKKNIKNIKKNKKNIITLNPPYLKYKNINLKKCNFQPVGSLTLFKKKNNIQKELKNIKRILKKKSKIIIENKNYEKIWK